MDFSPLNPGPLGGLTRLLVLIALLVLDVPAFSAGDRLTLQLTQADRLPQRITSAKQLNARAGDRLSLRSEFGEDYEFRVEAATRSNHGNKVIRGLNEAGARLTMVVTSDGRLQGSLRDGGRVYRLVQEAGEIVWHFADPYLARPADAGGCATPALR